MNLEVIGRIIGPLFRTRLVILYWSQAVQAEGVSVTYRSSNVTYTQRS